MTIRYCFPLLCDRRPLDLLASRERVFVQRDNAPSPAALCGSTLGALKEMDGSFINPIS